MYCITCEGTCERTHFDKTSAILSSNSQAKRGPPPRPRFLKQHGGESTRSRANTDNT